MGPLADRKHQSEQKWNECVNVWWQRNCLWSAQTCKIRGGVLERTTIRESFESPKPSLGVAGRQDAVDERQRARGKVRSEPKPTESTLESNCQGRDLSTLESNSLGRGPSTLDSNS